ncbi:MAG: serine/threonine protein kinase [Bdellovibrionota bacterium]
MTTSAWGDPITKHFFALTPNEVLAAIEEAGYRCTGLCYPLGSYENRVYEVEVEEDPSRGIVKKDVSSLRRVVKFYRPGRWTREQILEEHQFLAELSENEVPVIVPLPLSEGKTLGTNKQTGLFYALFPKVGGRAPEDLSEDQFQWLGRLLGRLHNVGAAKLAPHRVRLTPETYGLSNLNYLLEQNQLPAEMRPAYEAAVREICRLSEPLFAKTKTLRIHGDCHAGNILWGKSGPFLLDFDDMVMGPAAQDLWLLLPGRDEEGKAALEALLEGYGQMRGFDREELRLIEPLRALRFVHYSAWLARRWSDPAFPRAFPHFGTPKYWGEMTRDLQQQAVLVREVLG